MEERKENNEEVERWSGLKAQLTNLARFSLPPIPIQCVNILGFSLCAYSAMATGWIAALLFTTGQQGQARLWWTGAGYLLGAIFALLVMISVIHLNMSKIKLHGKDYSDVDAGYAHLGTNIFNAAARLTTIAACGMFLYAQVTISEYGRAEADNRHESKLTQLNRITVYKDSVFTSQVIYYRGLDFDDDRTNDVWARNTLEKIEKERKTEREIEDSLRFVLINHPEPERDVQLAAADGTVLLKDLAATKKPDEWGYKILLMLLSLLVGICVEGGITLCGNIIGRKKAFDNISKVYLAVEGQMQEIKDSYDSLPVKFTKQTRKFSLFGKGNGSDGSNSGGEGFDWNSERIKDMIFYIKENYRGYGKGDLTMEQIGEEFEVGRSYISQLFKAATVKGLLIDIRGITND